MAPGPKSTASHPRRAAAEMSTLMDIAADAAAQLLAEAQALKLTESAAVNEEVANVTGSSNVGVLLRQWVVRLEALDDAIGQAAARIARVDELRRRVSGAIERQVLAAEQRAEAERQGFALSLAEERLLASQRIAKASEAAAADAEVQLARAGVFLELQALFDELSVGRAAGSAPAGRGTGGARDAISSRSSPAPNLSRRPSTPTRRVFGRWSVPRRAASPPSSFKARAVTPHAHARQV